MAKNIVLWLVLISVFLVIAMNISEMNAPETIPSSDFKMMVSNGSVESVKIGTDVITIYTRDRKEYTTVYNASYVFDQTFIPFLEEHNVQVEYLQPKTPNLLTQLLVASFPILIIIAVFFFFMRQMQGGGGGKGGPMSFGKSKAKMLTEDQIKTTFADVAGVDEAKEDVEELVDFLRDPGKYHRLGGKIPRGVLMVGQPGTGKTLLAKAIAGEAKVPFFSISGSDFVEMFVGVGASRVRDMFEQAKKQAPCIVFIDEIDAVGRSRGVGMGGGNDEREQTLNQLLVEMDGFEANDGIIVIAATNRPDVLDPALKRPGRFDRQIEVSLPDVVGREQILKVHSKKVPLDSTVNLKVVARGTSRFSGADLANLVNEAALFAARLNKRTVSAEDFDKAKDKIIMGSERKNKVMTDQEKENTAYHESGHTILAYLSKESDPIHKVTIIPRSKSLGFLMQIPEGDVVSRSRQWFLSSIEVAYGGRIAEELIYGFDGVTTGAQQDIQVATNYARYMVGKIGFSKELGPVLYEKEEQNYLGGSGSSSDFTSSTRAKVDKEVMDILETGYTNATKILTDNRDILEAMKTALMEYETLLPDQIEDIMNRRPVQPPKNWNIPSVDTPAQKTDSEVTPKESDENNEQKD
ncbi:ATP-dependent zinc metalloprotease FtsH [Marinicellulosiphila megalodicopiae]|uniref:ATP-dependent zinc metalloprotease FtsH n=1 Tax=Marinicellulosiphila megalodicopiae TaxID=2724896 RepID=UPI003BAED350